LFGDVGLAGSVLYHKNTGRLLDYNRDEAEVGDNFKEEF
jgi:hypothetical protein